MAAKNTIGLGTGSRVLNATVTDTTVQTSYTTSLKFIDNISYQLVTTGTVAGAWTVEVSNNYASTGGEDGQAPTAGTWTNITALFSTLAAVTSGGSNQYIEKTNGLIGARTIRVKFTPTSGSGTAIAYVYGKGL